MAAYANLVSLMNLIEQIQLYHTHHPDFLDQYQNQLESLHEKVTNLQDLLEWFSLQRFNNDANDLESGISDAALDAGDTIENYIVDDVHSRTWKQSIMHTPVNFLNVFHKVDNALFPEKLHKSIERMDLMEKEMMKIKEKSNTEDQLRLPDLRSTVSPESPSDGKNDMVGFEDEFNEIMSKLIGHGSNLKIISITGMGGIGKSTLARSVCDNKSTINYFDVRGWIIISQNFNVEKRMFDLLKEIGAIEDKAVLENYNYHQLGEKLHKHLSGRRFLMIVDDIWNVEDWVKFKLFLPDNNKGSRIILTTRSLNVAKNVGSSDIYSVNFLDENTSWSLLCRKVFFNEPCPPMLLEVGKKIARNCKGLPLSLSVIGGLLAKLEKTCECWEKIGGDINTIVSSEEDERYLKLLALSYSHLPIYLKPCFLYMGIFPEDHSIGVESLLDLWMAEGFLKQRGASKSMEDVAKHCMEDLIARNLIYVVSGLGTRGRTQNVRIHDLLRDLAVREAQKQKFLGIATLSDPKLATIVNSERRVGLCGTKLLNNLRSKCEDAMISTTSLRTLMCDTDVTLLLTPGTRLRVAEHVSFSFSQEGTLHLINSRYLRTSHENMSEFFLLQRLWNLQVLIIDSPKQIEVPIWEMPLLKKLDTSDVVLLDPPADVKGYPRLTKLEKIATVRNFRCADEVLRKIPNMKELRLMYFSDESTKEVSHYCLNNLSCLNQLQSLSFMIFDYDVLYARRDWFLSIGFPRSLKKLALFFCGFEWEDLTTKVGSLPLLEDLQLGKCNTGEEWILDEEGAFPCLKFLQILRTNLVKWSAESIHFPCLEELSLVGARSLEEIPYEIGEVASLQAIHLDGCSKSCVASAKIILKEQRSFGNDGLRVMVNQKHIQEEEEEEEEEDDDDEDKEEKQVQKKKTSKLGFAAFSVPFLVMLGFGFVLLRNRFGRKGKGVVIEIPKRMKDEDRGQGREADNGAWFLSYDYP